MQSSDKQKVFPIHIGMVLQ